MKRILHNRGNRYAKTVLLFVMVLSVLAVPRLKGQTATGPDGSSATAQPQSGNSAERPDSPSRQLAKESNEADDENQFKHSSSVQFVAKLTGISLDYAYWLCVLLNFAVIAIAIFWVAKKNLPGMFRNRTAEIQKAMQEARKASEDANRRLADIESRLSRLDAEIGTMRTAAEKEGAAEELRIKAAAEEDARRIVESAEQEIAAATKAARRELTAYAADLAVTLATRQIHVDSPTDQALVRSFARELADNGGGPGKVRQ
jgi:F-type H+-transporting ATPase subunit b